MEHWQKAGLTQDEWVAHVLRKAADRRELAYGVRYAVAGSCALLGAAAILPVKRVR